MKDTLLGKRIYMGDLCSDKKYMSDEQKKRIELINGEMRDIKSVKVRTGGAGRFESVVVDFLDGSRLHLSPAAYIDEDADDTRNDRSWFTMSYDSKWSDRLEKVYDKRNEMFPDGSVPSGMFGNTD